MGYGVRPTWPGIWLDTLRKLLHCSASISSMNILNEKRHTEYLPQCLEYRSCTCSAQLLCYIDVCNTPQTAHGLVEKENAQQVISILLVIASFKEVILIPALVCNQVKGEAQKKNTAINTRAVSYWVSEEEILSLWFQRKSLMGDFALWNHN